MLRKHDRVCLTAVQRDHELIMMVLISSTGRVWSWVPKVYATRMYNLGADYQTSRIGAEEAQSVAHEIGKMVFADLNARGECNLLQFLSQTEAV